MTIELLSDASDITNKFGMLKKEHDLLTSKIAEKKIFLKLITETKMFLTSFSEYSRDHVKSKLETITNFALNSIFRDKEIKFRIVPKKTKRGLEYLLYIESNGGVKPLEDSNGGGVMDVIAMCLRIAFLQMFRLRNVMILDEPFKNLDGNRLPYAVEWLKTVSLQFGIQFIMVTHIDQVKDVADRVFELEQINGNSRLNEHN